MIQQTLDKIENTVRQDSALGDSHKQELLGLLGQLKGEIHELAKTHSDEAHSIADFTAVSTREAIREQPNPKLVRISLEGLSTSVSEFEGSHPRLVQLVNSVCSALSNIGI